MAARGHAVDAEGRYDIMRAYMPKKGKLGLDMMLRTCTVQVNLDFASEADMVKKFRVSLALQPIATALFANSPFTEGKPNGFLSYRSQIWTDTDPDRSGMLPFVFDPGMGFERYVDYALDVPMYFVYRDGAISTPPARVPRLLAGRLPALPGAMPTMATGRITSPRVPRSAAQALPRNARRRRRPVAAALRAAGALGRTQVPRPDLEGMVARRAGHIGSWSARPRETRHHARRRKHLSRHAVRNRRQRHHPGRKAARGISRPLGRQDRAALRGTRLLIEARTQLLAARALDSTAAASREPPLCPR
jgi:hypothetical protein